MFANLSLVDLLVVANASKALQNALTLEAVVCAVLASKKQSLIDALVDLLLFRLVHSCAVSPHRILRWNLVIFFIFVNVRIRLLLAKQCELCRGRTASMLQFFVDKKHDATGCKVQLSVDNSPIRETHPVCVESASSLPLTTATNLTWQLFQGGERASALG